MLYDKLVKNAGTLWTDYTEHEFATQLANATMKREKFDHYLQQDYLYLIAYQKCFDHMIKFSNTEEEQKYFEKNSIGDLENDLAIAFNVNVENIKMTSTTSNYINYLYEQMASTSGLVKLVTLAPCAIGYGMMGKYLLSLPIKKNNPYQQWIDTYSDVDYETAINEYINLINKYEIDDNEFEMLSQIFNNVCDLEIKFFNQVLERIKPQVLTIAGSDSGGGAGIQADIKSISANGGYASSVVTVITAQNTQGVQNICELSSEIIASQMKSVLDDLTIKAIKIGMLGGTRIINTVAENLPTNIPIVLDPVMVAKDKSVLLQNEAINDIVTKLFPKVFLITPNIDEAEQILNIKISNEDEMKDACLKLNKLGAKNVLVKGGHLTNNNLVDVLYFNNKFYTFKQQRINTKHTHGTGCSLSSSIATNIAKGMTLNKAVEEGIHYVYDGILLNYKIGKGISPINHFNEKITIN